MSPSKTKKIYGPPGTGKTTFLLNIVEQELLKDGMLTKDVVEDLKEDVTKDIPKKGLMSREPIEEEIQ